MALNIKSFLFPLNFILINTVLLAASSVTAESKQIESTSASHLKQSKKIESNNTINTQFQFIFAEDSNITNIAAVESENGVPSLRRQPGSGEKFEPRRIPLQVPLPKQPYRSSPSITIINPSGYGASWGNAGIGIGFQERARFTDESDGVIGFGFGVGNSRKNIGAQVGISLVDVSSPFQDGAINLKLHRRLPQDFSVAAGVQGIVTWGNTDGGSSVYGVTTKRFKLRQDRTKAFSEIYTTVGVGGGQFRTESNINSGNENVGVFGSLAVKAAQPVGLVAEWTGQDLTIGLPVIPFRRLPLVIVPAVTDITGSAGDGARFVVGLGYSFSY
ncbi:MAG: hypothetical protein AAF652_11365 [Cyanobacteria bacterium P01_C01_bin.72]